MFTLRKVKLKAGVYRWQVLKIDGATGASSLYQVVKNGAKALGLVRLLNGQAPVGESTKRF